MTISGKSKLEKICSYGFAGTSIASFTAPDSLRQIESMAFCECQSLSTVKLNDKLQGIGTMSFLGTSVNNLALPKGIKTLPAKLGVGYHANEVQIIP